MICFTLIKIKTNKTQRNKFKNTKKQQQINKIKTKYKHKPQNKCQL